MTGFHEVRFPDNIAYGATGGPEFATTVVATGSGHEKRNVNWSEARGRWDVASGLKKQAQIDELIAFFRARRGKAYGFRFKGWTDYKATGQLLGTGDDAKTQFQLLKHYPSGSVIEVRTITKPVTGTVKVYLDAVEQPSGWSVDTTTGLVTLGTAPIGCRGHCRLRVRRAGAVRYRSYGGDHRDLPAARLAANPNCRTQDLRRSAVLSRHGGRGVARSRLDTRGYSGIRQPERQPCRPRWHKLGGGGVCRSAPRGRVDATARSIRPGRRT